MKTCPVCDAVAFDDATTCYGCLHRFGEDAPHEEIASVGETLPARPDEAEVSGFLIKLIPLNGSAGNVTWTCAVEAASC